MLSHPMKNFCLIFLFAAVAARPQTPGDLAVTYLRDLIRLDTSNPPGNESRVARYLKQVADREGIPAELPGDNPQRLHFVARLRGTGQLRPPLLPPPRD